MRSGGILELVNGRYHKRWSDCGSVLKIKSVDVLKDLICSVRERGVTGESVISHLRYW